MGRNTVRRALFAAAAAVGASLVPATAAADDAKPSDAAEPQPKRLALRTGANYIAGKVGPSRIARAQISAGASYDVTPRFTVYADLGFDTMRITYDGAMADRLHLNTTLWSYAGLSGETGLMVRLLQTKRFELDAHALFETSLIDMPPSTTGVNARTAQGSFDVTPYAAKQTETDLRWNRFGVGSTMRLRLTRTVTPMLTVAFERVDASMDLHLTEDSRKTLTRLGYDPQEIEGRHRVTYYMVPITPGTEFRLGDNAWLGINTTIAPAADSAFWGCAAYLKVGLF